MTADPQDPRREVLDELHDRMAATFAGLAREDPPTATETLDALDDADPLRAMLGKVEQRLRWIRDEVDPDRMRTTDHVPDEEYIYNLATQALARVLALTPTEGGTDDD